MGRIYRQSVGPEKVTLPHWGLLRRIDQIADEYRHHPAYHVAYSGDDEHGKIEASSLADLHAGFLSSDKPDDATISVGTGQDLALRSLLFWQTAQGSQAVIEGRDETTVLGIARRIQNALESAAAHPERATWESVEPSLPDTEVAYQPMPLGPPGSGQQSSASAASTSPSNQSPGSKHDVSTWHQLRHSGWAQVVGGAVISAILGWLLTR